MKSRENIPYSERARRMEPSAIRTMTKLAAEVGPDLISFAGGMPGPSTFPLQELAKISNEEILSHAGKSLQYGMTTGFRPLLAWISNFVSKRNVQAKSDQICCTTGSQQALSLISEILINPGDVIFLESPTYIGALAAFRNSGAALVTVAQDSEGIVLEELEEKLRLVSAERRKLVYVVSNFQNPSGISLSVERRKNLAALIEKYGVFLIEDDPYGEIYFGDSNLPPAAIQSWNPERVLYLSTFSKVVAPTFRTGWIVGSQDLIRKIELAKEAADLCGSMLDQRILCRFCSSPDFESHLGRLRSYYTERCDAMQQSLLNMMPKDVQYTRPKGGFFIWLQLPEHLDAESFLEESIRQEKVSFIIGRAFSADNSTKNFLRLAFSVESPKRIEEGINRLSNLIRRRLDGSQRRER
jgi:2-aminoadipate transaminase